ncbi:MAG: hypothetical protein ACOX8S_10980 [Christensenellales bacterium]|jgi:polyphosphate kinase
MLVDNPEGVYKQLLVAPFGINSSICAFIDEEIAKGKGGYICITANSITEREAIDKLKEASGAGVEIQLILRGICCMLPGIADHTEDVHVTSIVGCFLERARINRFGKGDGAKLYLPSADLMTRNLNRRVKIAFTIHNFKIEEQLRWILSCQLRGNLKAGYMMPGGLYRRKKSDLALAYISQQEFMEQSFREPTHYAPAKRPLSGRSPPSFGGSSAA